VREFLSDRNIPFEDRNIRQSEATRDELERRTQTLVVPQIFWGEQRLVGFDPDALEELVAAYRQAGA
jgi:glutaredoxin